MEFGGKGTESRVRFLSSKNRVVPSPRRGRHQGHHVAKATALRPGL